MSLSAPQVSGHGDRCLCPERARSQSPGCAEHPGSKEPGRVLYPNGVRSQASRGRGVVKERSAVTGRRRKRSATRLAIVPRWGTGPYLAPSTRGAQRTPGFAILPFQGTNTDRHGRAFALLRDIGSPAPLGSWHLWGPAYRTRGTRRSSVGRSFCGRLGGRLEPATHF